MTMSDADALHYVGILEAVVATLAIRCGIDPKAMIARTIEDITETAGMETAETERVIRERWDGRDMQASALVAKSLSTSTDIRSTLRSTEPPERPDMAARLSSYQERRLEEASDSSA